MILTERQLKNLIERLLNEGQIADNGSIKIDNDPYTYKIYKVASDSIGIKVIEKNGKPFEGTFDINKSNANNTGPAKILKIISSNLDKLTKWTDIGKTINSLTKSAGIDSKVSSSSSVSDSGTKAKKSFTAPKNLNFSKMWSNLSVRDWVNSKEDVIGAIRYKGADYYSWGFVEASLTKGETVTGLAVSVPFEVYKEMSLTLGPSNIKLIPQDKPVKRIKPSSGSLLLKTEKGMVPILVKEGTKQIQLGTYEFDSGADVSAEAITTVLDIIGVVPIIGIPFDVANVIVSLSFPEPRLFAALLSALAVIPTIGEAIGAAKVIKSAPKIAKGVKAGEKIADILKGVGIKTLRDTIKTRSFLTTIMEHTDDIAKLLENPRLVSEISKKFPGLAKRIETAIPLFIQYLKDFKYFWTTWRDLPFNRIRREANQWLNLTQSGRQALVGAIDEEAIDKALVESGVYSVFEISATQGDVIMRIEKIAKKIVSLGTDPKKLDDFQALAISKYNDIMSASVKTV